MADIVGGYKFLLNEVKKEYPFEDIIGTESLFNDYTIDTLEEYEEEVSFILLNRAAEMARKREKKVSESTAVLSAKKLQRTRIIAFLLSVILGVVSFISGQNFEAGNMNYDVTDLRSQLVKLAEDYNTLESFYNNMAIINDQLRAQLNGNDINAAPVVSTAERTQPSSAKQADIPQPENGEIIVNTCTGKLVAPFKFYIKEDKLYYIVLARDTGEIAIAYFISKNGTTVNAPIGDFNIYYAVGTKWQDATNHFGSATEYYKMDIKASFYYMKDGYVSGNELTIYDVIDGNVETEEIEYADFPGFQ